MIADALRVLDGQCVLRDRLNQRDDVDFLTASLSYSERRTIRTIHPVGALYLARYDQHGSRIQPCAGYARNCIGAARAGRYQGDA